jgi:hypothetical protein
MKRVIQTKMFAALIPLVTLSLFLSAGCYIDPLGKVAYDMQHQQRQVEAQARKPYYGTGVVTRVAGVVDVTFEQAPLPPRFAKFIIVRNNAIVAKVKSGFGERDRTYMCWITEGTPRLGDLALGWQREAEFTKRQMHRRSDEPLQPTAVHSATGE